MLIREPLGAIVNEKTRISRENSTTPPVQAKLIAMEYLRVLREKVGYASEEAREPFERDFNEKVRHGFVIKTGDRIYIEESLNWTIGETDAAT